MLSHKLFVSGVIVTLAASAAFAAPKVQFEKETLDFGKVKSGDPINVTFTLKNVGDSDLHITQVKPGCGCTKAAAKKPMLAPNESTTIDAVFNSAGFGGRISKSIAITTNDPDRGSLSLSIQGEVIPFAKVTPTSVSFKDIRKNLTSTFMLTVIPTDPKGFSVLNVTPTGSHLTITSFRKVDEKAGPYWQVFGLIKAGATPGRVMESVRIQTNAVKNPYLSVMVYGNVVE